jgi:putative membrane-bound dehydrogenase-like protein
MSRSRRSASIVHIARALACVVFATLLVHATLSADERPPQVETLLPGVTLSLVAEHPQLATPTGVDVDSEGRIWVVATHTHFPPDDYAGPKHDEILVFADRDGDGRAEERTLFYNQTTATMDLELGPNGWVYLAERDRILRVRDTDGDGAADDSEDLLTLETEADYPHNGLEGLAWHPDGTLVFGLGENFAHPWTLTDRDGNTVSGTGEGGIFRCTADGRELRRIALGFWNPFGICVRDDGEVFAAENDPGEMPPCRLLHIVEGGDYGYQRSYGHEAHHPFVGWNGELRGTLPMIHPSGEAPCGVTPLGRGLIVPSWSDHRIDFFLLSRRGASYSAERMALVQGGRYFRPGCIAPAPDQSGSKRTWYLTDWVDGRYESHGYGRLWRLEVDLDAADWVGPLELEPPTEEARLAAELREGKTQRDAKSLLALARHEDPFVARAALLALRPHAESWTPDEVAGWPDEDRLQAVLALKLAGGDPQRWVGPFLQDENPDIQFETLRWICDERLSEFLPEVEAVLDRSDLDYVRFEAAIATWNTLNGQPEAGVRNESLLLARVQDADSSPRVRAYALRLLPMQSRSAPRDGSAPVQSFPEGLTLQLLRGLLDLDDPTLSLEVVRTLAANPRVSAALLSEIASDDRRDPLLRAEAVTGLAAVAEDHVTLLVSLAGDGERAVREEALRALRSLEHSSRQIQDLEELAERYPDSADLVRAVLEPQSLANGRPELSDTPAWQRALAAIEAPADPQAGGRIFHHPRLTRCANCHRHDGRGSVVGPDLSGLAQRDDSTWLLRSILEPSREMSPQYQPRTLLLKDGQTFTGIRLRSSTMEAMRDANGQNRTFNRDEIDSWVESPVSFMPAGLVHQLTDRELRDLLAFLEQADTSPRRQSP